MEQNKSFFESLADKIHSWLNPEEKPEDYFFSAKEACLYADSNGLDKVEMDDKVRLNAYLIKLSNFIKGKSKEQREHTCSYGVPNDLLKYKQDIVDFFSKDVNGVHYDVFDLHKYNPEIDEKTLLFQWTNKY